MAARLSLSLNIYIYKNKHGSGSALNWRNKNIIIIISSLCMHKSIIIIYMAYQQHNRHHIIYIIIIIIIHHIPLHIFLLSYIYNNKTSPRSATQRDGAAGAAFDDGFGAHCINMRAA